MKIGILADTHIQNDIKYIEGVIENHFKEVDLIIHAGDYISKEVVEIFQSYKAFIGVWGNVDNLSIRSTIKEKEMIMLENYKIGIFHGHGTGKTTLDRAYNAFKDDMADIIIFGHSHQPLLKTKNNILMINPGSLTNKRKERWFTYIILELKGGDIDLQFKFLS